ncbi:TetR/AcrR family transcriptional regulator [Kribbella sp. NPDC058245]|uniref:TetR/AcrR family transcriptional regulator n=1 Tax=Kribbella sp. NPDC058245 TaxID=3346399 RepID=UPI0036ED4B7E
MIATEGRTGSADRPVETHRDRLLREGLAQLYARGFHGTTVDGILTSSGVPKGSFYHHFGSKEAFAAELLRGYTSRQLERIDRWSATPGLSTADALTGYFGELTGMLVESGYRRACLIGKLATEVAVSNDQFRDQLSLDLDVWKQRLTVLFERGRERGDVRTDQPAAELADVVLALIQGAFVVTLATRDRSSLESVAHALKILIAPTA